MEQEDIIRLFCGEKPKNILVKNTSHGDEDYRENWIVEFENHKLVIKLAANDFTDEEHLIMWEKISKEYQALGYYCPNYVRALDGTFPHVRYEGHDCIAYAEEYSRYPSAEEFIEKHPENKLIDENGYYTYFRDMVLMDAKVASRYSDYTNLPSGMCMFELFVPSDKVDETKKDALKWKGEADKLPEKFQNQVKRIWNNWLDARNELEKIYDKLPRSVFQADNNVSNILVNENGDLCGVYDFNLGGKDVFINLLVRLIPYNGAVDDQIFSEDYYSKSIINALKIAREVYSFSDLEKKAMPLLYKCVKPLWWKSSRELEEAKGDEEKIQESLDFSLWEQTREIGFEKYM